MPPPFSLKSPFLTVKIWVSSRTLKTFISCYRTPGPQKGFRRGFRRGLWSGLWRVAEGFQKSFRRVLSWPEDPSKTLRKPFENPSETPSETLRKPFWNPSGVRGFCGRKWRSWLFCTVTWMSSETLANTHTHTYKELLRSEAPFCNFRSASLSRCSSASITTI